MQQVKTQKSKSGRGRWRSKHVSCLTFLEGLRRSLAELISTQKHLIRCLREVSGDFFCKRAYNIPSYFKQVLSLSDKKDYGVTSAVAQESK